MKRAYQETAEEGRADVSRNVSAKLSIEPISINDIECPKAKAAFEKRLDDALHRDKEDENQSSPLLLHDVKPWIEATLKAIEEYPILAQTVDQNGFSLLHFCCQAVNGHGRFKPLDLVEEQTYAVDALKELIEKNPHALGWNIEQGQDPLKMMCNSSVLLHIVPWIIQRYPWVFEQSACAKDDDKDNSPLCTVIAMCLLFYHQQAGRDYLFSPSLLKDLLDQCPQLIGSDVMGESGGGVFLIVFAMWKRHQHPELLEFMVRKRPDLPLVKSNGNSIFAIALGCFLKTYEQAGTSHSKAALVESFHFKILELMLNLCPSAALVPCRGRRNTEIPPITILLTQFTTLGGGLALIELIAHIARIMYPNFEELAPADVKDNALMKKVVGILDKEKEAAVISIRLKRSKLMFSKGNHNKEAQDLYGCWVTNQLIPLNDQIKQYREKDIPALKDWKEEPQDNDGSDEEEYDDSSEDDDDESSEDGNNDGAGDAAHEDDE